MVVANEFVWMVIGTTSVKARIIIRGLDDAYTSC
jgi:hypothetical protein